MSQVFIVSFFGEDKPGLVQQLAEQTHKYEGKWLQSKVSHLEGRVAGLLKVEVAEASAEALQRYFTQLASLNVELSSPAATTGAAQVVTKLRVDAKDRPGIVNDISSLLDSQSVKTHNFECHRVGLVDIGGSMFSASLDVELPEGVKPEDLIAQITALDTDMVVSAEH